MLDFLTDQDLQSYARIVADTLVDPDKKQLRFNDIVRVARRFYPSLVIYGVAELVQSCDRAAPSLYVAKAPMWQVLEDRYGWMFPEG
jgi:hypothetical protein